jgi:hypothetical protein
MARKKKAEKFSVVKAVKSAAREQIGTVRPTKPVPDAKEKAKRRAEKHRKTLRQMLSSE